jgi:hypothetical protein
VSDNEIIHIEIPEQLQAEYVSDLADFIEKELKPPSRMKWMLFFFIMGVSAGMGLGLALWWVR